MVSYRKYHNDILCGLQLRISSFTHLLYTIDNTGMRAQEVSPKQRADSKTAIIIITATNNNKMALYH